MLTLVQTERYKHWIDHLKDREAQIRITRHLSRCALYGKILGDAKGIGLGTTELRFHFGPGYKAYLSKERGRIVPLLAGGDKASQQKDIAGAKLLVEQWRRENADV